MTSMMMEKWMVETSPTAASFFSNQNPRRPLVTLIKKLKTLPIAITGSPVFDSSRGPAGKLWLLSGGGDHAPGTGSWELAT
jgi:hypothetical protein